METLMSPPHTRGNYASASWSVAAVTELRLMASRQATPLLPIPTGCGDVAVFLKDESVQETGSLKFRLALSLLVDAVCSGRVHQRSHLFDASSGSTAIAEAAVAIRLGLPFTACVPVSVSQGKIDAIRRYGGSVIPAANLDEAREMAAKFAAEQGGHFLDQFGQAERVMDWRGDDCLGAELLNQTNEAASCQPDCIVMAVGTGSSLSAVARHFRYSGARTKICLADPEASQLHRRWLCPTSRASPSKANSILVEGIGACGEHQSFNPSLIDSVEAVTDSESIAAAHVLSEVIGRKVGASSGTSFSALARQVGRRTVQSHSVLVSFIYDDGERYSDSIYSDKWLHRHGIDLRTETVAIRRFLATGVLHAGSS